MVFLLVVIGSHPKVSCGRPTLPSVLNKKVASFQDKVELYNTKKTETIKSFENKKKKELDVFFKNLNEIMNVYMKENSISIIIDKKNVIMASVKNDISNDIIELVNK